ncbi:putative membrane protein [Rivularia sp. PCC 7116]|uniref:phosphate-starvation-inducible PsiE family protein n=1 Tax=Rivularia sp. PCC 7116 TaxID=373994 RepID=UPI00029F34DC|nr:phosphate-starvation-inducible PsiE family protein [Rivularia sp. PCC 7116]AFY53681.1 putative membrane protein [Rivularia sp. PCC 7116]
MRNLFRQIRKYSQNENFLHIVENLQVLVSKLLSITMIVLILIAIVDLVIFIFDKLLTWDVNKASFNKNLFTAFGLFLNILIALEILENITAYLRKSVIHVELVIATSLIAVARKIIILDLKNTEGLKVIGLGIAVFSLSISYWIIRRSHRRNS